MHNWQLGHSNHDYVLCSEHLKEKLVGRLEGKWGTLVLLIEQSDYSVLSRPLIISSIGYCKVACI